ncbi:5-amino-6-(5-phospho-D-ribitylamino)uracil phosphatase YigB [Edwardsiella ictaluri]|uniref:HAD-superfamily hydrolase, subfamily IA, variant 1 n=1 Tax=Edwardsiella ictaluri (strain 93-146) TaxID=634503 RepID=C5BBD7_EDWI9|nr:5-amino-6-(5-phospho-D-ribitylamino)uracil phosphatase YigB [Edwardsiella ictaluri]ACR67372.1 HAD-superfamily hydrolase, subfamily IA, variant 1 [Edwardsiella ictaluri 93-146]AVZ82118.1 5-amino-6-(5-phospho-D-ribitylamino)uracil phosphatase YigB [Edwardsiella ictaluri]EKS7762710.1 5-amino-6-(5-phospho-D-ribitylamino)uracil phosphatase YigB [Edwardsiella ictaluri]EKS7769621.1 5-amino-6-(5-phospho-D-ribitylamino)uracil phosphatase YigB [Edwardsiella ictaluri]EKS7772674.1 5-amino-6-(5-phospho-
MHFYRRLQRPAALTFDLDDTLYDNHPVIVRSEQAALDFLRRRFPALQDFRSADWQRLRAELRASDPEIYHDVTQWRWRTVYEALWRAGLSPAYCHDGADEAMAHFAQWRSRITVPSGTHQTLKALAARLPLAAITNGNADPARCGLGEYFRFVLRAGPAGRAKPYSDMYLAAAQRFGLAPAQILHVGDDLTTDVAGAVRSGMQACWVNDRGRSLLCAAEGRLLPHVEISRLDSLLALI